MHKILEEMKKHRLFFDGGTGSILQAKGLAQGELPETWNLLHPEILIQLHRDYLEAGADIINTNTFGANGLKFHKGTEFELAPLFSQRQLMQKRRSASLEKRLLLCWIWGLRESC